MNRANIIRSTLEKSLIFMPNENVKKLLSKNMWDLATCGENEPNVVPVAFKDVTEDERLVVGDVFLETTLKNIKENGGKNRNESRFFKSVLEH